VIKILQHPRDFFTKNSPWLHFVLQVAVPSILFQTYLHFYDHHLGRSAEPFGMFVYTANLTTIFVPTQGPIYSLFSFFYQFKYQEWEGWAYIGTSMLFVVLFSLIKILRYLYRKKVKIIFKPALNSILQPAIWASVLVLFFSFGYPFKLHMKFLLDWFPFLKQFRSLGRFAWVFYYVFSVYGMYMFYLFVRLLKQRKRIIISCLLQFCFFALLLVDGISNHLRVSSLVSNSKNIFRYGTHDEWVTQLIQSGIQHKYQAILPLPFYHIGSEAQTRTGSSASMIGSMKLAYDIDLPLIASSCARTSTIEAANIMQLLSPVSFKKTAKGAFKNHNPVLITYSKEELPYDEAALLSRATKIFSGQQMDLYELPFDSLFYYSGSSEIIAFESARPLLHTKSGFEVNDTAQFFLSKTFDENSSAKIFAGKGAFEGKMNVFNFILPDTVLDLDTSQYYEASFWYYNKGVFINLNTAFIREKSIDGKYTEVIANQSTLTCSNISGDWSLVKLVFKPKYKGDSISISLRGNDDLEIPIYVDELLIRPFFTDIYKTLESKNGKVTALYKNNVALER